MVYRVHHDLKWSNTAIEKRHQTWVVTFCRATRASFPLPASNPNTVDTWSYKFRFYLEFLNSKITFLWLILISWMCGLFLQVWFTWSVNIFAFGVIRTGKTSPHNIERSSFDCIHKLMMLDFSLRAYQWFSIVMKYIVTNAIQYFTFKIILKINTFK